MPNSDLPEFSADRISNAAQKAHRMFSGFAEHPFALCEYICWLEDINESLREELEVMKKICESH